jgi:hypothetical protein
MLHPSILPLLAMPRKKARVHRRKHWRSVYLAQYVQNSRGLRPRAFSLTRQDPPRRGSGDIAPNTGRTLLRSCSSLSLENRSPGPQRLSSVNFTCTLGILLAFCRSSPGLQPISCTTFAYYTDGKTRRRCLRATRTPSSNPGSARSIPTRSPHLLIALLQGDERDCRGKTGKRGEVLISRGIGFYSRTLGRPMKNARWLAAIRFLISARLHVEHRAPNSNRAHWTICGASGSKYVILFELLWV